MYTVKRMKQFEMVIAGLIKCDWKGATLIEVRFEKLCNHDWLAMSMNSSYDRTSSLFVSSSAIFLLTNSSLINLLGIPSFSYTPRHSCTDNVPLPSLSNSLKALLHPSLLNDKNYEKDTIAKKTHQE